MVAKLGYAPGEMMFYTVTKNSRWFKPGVLYSDVDWSSLPAIVDAFAERLEDWYVKPAEALRASGHFAFAAMALNCILLDTLSQYYSGNLSSKAGTFKDFVRLKLPEFGQPLPLPVRHFDAQKNKVTQLMDFAEVLYHAFRCGIVHEAHVTPYGMIHGGAGVVFVEPSCHVKYTADGSDCPSVIIDPWALLERVKSMLGGYVRNLKDPDPGFETLRANFRTKFSEAFGVDISEAV